MMSLRLLLLCLGVVGRGLGAEVYSTLIPCGNNIMYEGQTVAVQSPDYPNTYPQRYRCQYEITCNPRETTKLTFWCPTFEIPASTDCVHDRLIVKYTGPPNTWYCGNNSPDGLVTTDGWTRITFWSNPLRPVGRFQCFILCSGDY